MINDLCFLGEPIEFKDKCLIYPPKISDAAKPKFDAYVKMMTITQEEIEDEFTEHNIPLNELLTPFEYILNNAYYSPEFKSALHEAFYLFIHEPILILFEQKSIILGDIKEIKTLENLRVLKEEDFFDFQNCARQSLGQSKVDPPNPNEDPRIKKLKAKARYRDRVKAQTGKGLKLISMLSSICCMGMGINPLNIGELSYASVSTLLARYQNKEKYEFDMNAILQGADSKKVKPKYWINNLED